MAAETRPTPSPRLAAAAPPGVQPEVDGWMLCLECAVWRRSIGRHLQAHGMTAADYRERHGLRLRHPLVTADVREGHSERARERIAADPQGWAEQFRHPPEIRARYAAAGRESIAATGDRPGAVAAVRGGWDRALASRTARMRDELEGRARMLGHADLAAFLGAGQGRSATALAAELGVTVRTIQAARRRLLGGVPDVGRPADASVRARQLRLDDKARAAGYADMATLIASTTDRPVKTLSRETGIAVNTIKVHRAAQSC